MSHHEDIILDQQGSTLIITLNRPEKLNAITADMAWGMSAAMDLLDDTPGLSVGVICGAGRAFCAGYDLNPVGGRTDGKTTMTDRGFAGLVERPSRKPLIAAVEGYAAGGGFEIALACDMLVVSDAAIAMLPEVKRGMAAGGGGILALVERAPRNLAAEALLTGGRISASMMAEWGLANRVVPEGQALPMALELAATVAESSPLSVIATKEIIAGVDRWPREEFFTRQREILKVLNGQADAQEGARAFLERRAAVWPSSANG